MGDGGIPLEKVRAGARPVPAGMLRAVAVGLSHVLRGFVCPVRRDQGCTCNLQSPFCIMHLSAPTAHKTASMLPQITQSMTAGRSMALLRQTLGHGGGT